MKKVVMFIFLVVILNSCGSAEFEEIENQYETKMELDKNTFVEQIYTEVVGKDAKKNQIRVYVKFRVNNDVIKLPKELHYNGLILTDDGKYSDLNKGDGVYTSFTDVTKVDYDYEVGSKFFIVYENNLLKKAKTRISSDRKFYIGENKEMFSYFKCKVDLVGVGSKCFGDICPEKSFFGGRTWFCICTSDCEFCIGKCN